MKISEIISSPLIHYFPDPVLVLNAKGEIQAFNKKYLKEYGFTKTKVQGKMASDFLTENSIKIFKSKFRKLKELTLQEAEIEIICGDGKIKNVWRKGVPIVENEKFCGLIAFDRDITKRVANEIALEGQQENLKLEINDRASKLKLANRELRNTLQLLTKEEEKNHRLIGAIPDYLFTLNEKGTIVDCYFPVKNPWNFDPKNFLNKSIFKLFPMPTARLIYNNLNKSIKSRRLSIFYLTIEFKGVVRHQEVRMIASEQVVLAIVRDITEKILADQALMDSEDKLRTIIQATNEGIIAIDNTGKVITFNRAAESIFKIKDKDIIGKNLNQILPEDVRPFHFDYVKNFFKSGRPNKIIGRVVLNKARRSDGTEFPIEISLSEGISGEKKYIVAVLRDITKKLEAEQELINSVESYKGIFNNVSDAIYIQDQHGCFIDVNECAEKMYGYPKSTFIGKTPEFLSPPGYNNLEETAQLIDKAFNGEPQKFKFWGLRKNGEIFPKEVYVFKGKYFGKDAVIAVAKDITDQINYEKELKTARQKAEESDKLKSSFLANMSHEIRTPMNSIIGFSDLLLNEENKEKRERFIKVLKSNGEHLMSIINDIIDISKIEAGLMEVELSVFSLKDEMGRIFSLFDSKEKVLKKKIELSFINNENIDFIKLDKSKFIQIMINLIGNSIKFTEKGKVVVDCKVIEKEGVKSLEFSVKDTGIGISKMEQKHIFDRFRQINNGLEYNESRGTGLGLSITKAFVEMMGGDIKVISDKGKGTKMIFSLPLHRVLKNEVYSKIKTSVNEKIYWKGKKILIVEDNKTNAFLLAAFLKSTHADLIFTEKGEESIKICSENSEIDLVVMDIKLPGINGYEATRQIKKINNKLPVIAHTAYALDSDITDAYEAGCDDHIAKPTSKKKFLSILQKYL